MRHAATVNAVEQSSGESRIISRFFDIIKIFSYYRAPIFEPEYEWHFLLLFAA